MSPPHFEIRKRRIFVMGTHIVFIVAAYVLTFLIRYDFELSPRHWPILLKTLPVLVLIQMGMFWRFHAFKELLRYTGIRDLFEIFRLIGGNSQELPSAKRLGRSQRCA